MKPISGGIPILRRCIRATFLDDNGSLLGTEIAHPVAARQDQIQHRECYVNAVSAAIRCSVKRESAQKRSARFTSWSCKIFAARQHAVRRKFLARRMLASHTGAS